MDFTCTPRIHFEEALTKVNVKPTHGNIRDISLASLAPGAAQPLLYDKQMLRTLTEGTQEDVRAAITDERTANAQGRNGDTLLMKACRAITNQPELSKGWLVQTLLSMKADPMVRCHAHKNLLHDLFWTAKPPPVETLIRMKEVTALIHSHLGTQRVLELVVAPDLHGSRPLDYLHKSQHEAWCEALDLMLSSPNIDKAGHNDSSDTTPATKSSDICEIDIIRGMVTLGRTSVQLIELLDSNATALMQLLQSLGTSFLIAEFRDPDYNIVATTAAFCELTLYQPDEVLGQNCRFLQGPGTEIAEVNKIRVALATKGACLVNVLNFRKDGSEFRNNLAFIPLLDTHGNAIFSIGIQNCLSSIYLMYFESMKHSPCTETNPCDVLSQNHLSKHIKESHQEPSPKRLRMIPGPELESIKITAQGMQVMKGHKPAIEILSGLSKKGRALLMHLHELKVPFLLSDWNDPDCIIICAAESFCQLTGFGMDEVLGINCRFLQGPKTDLDEVNKIRVALKTEGSAHVSLLNYRKDGQQFTNNLAIFPLHNADANLSYYIGIQNCPASLFAFLKTVNICTTCNEVCV